MPAGENLEQMAKRFGSTVNKIRWSNPKSNFAPGEIIFIPMKLGLLETARILDATKYFQSGELTWPVPRFNQVSSYFGGRWGKKHEGIDIPAPVGTPIVAVTDGQVVYSGEELGGYGNLTVIAHKGGLFTVYAHANVNLTIKGQLVKKGEQIAAVGNTGHSTGAHLHFELRQDGEAQNPLLLFRDLEDAASNQALSGERESNLK
jgi:murein DD-endopeptidase MepM/ murein hydrolase activator NlpD